MDKWLKPRPTIEIVRDWCDEYRFRRYMPKTLAHFFVISSRLGRQNWRDAYDRMPWQPMYLVVFAIVVGRLFH